MKRTRISSNSPFEAQIAYSRAVVAGDWVFVSGTTGVDYSTMTISSDIAEQTDQCLKNIAFALRQAGSPCPHFNSKRTFAAAALPLPLL
jgi:enamine deaminase RidA (YjgF/YER057c/UK114 family)